MKKGVIFLISCVLSSALYAQPEDWDALNQQAITHLTQLIEIDTAQPKPQELKAARYIYKQLNKHKIDWDIFIPVKGRANLVARLKGTDPNLKPLLLISHLDTAPVSENWTFSPFKATRQDGRIYGLGATDAKNYTAAYLALFTFLADQSVRPQRDIIFLATAGEESGSEPGLLWLEETHWDQIASGYALNEGGGIIPEEDGAYLVFVEASTKMYMDILLTARGEEVHPSIPTNRNAVYILSQALAKIADYNPPARLISVSRTFFESILPLQDEDGKTTIQFLLDGNEQNQQSAADVMSQDSFFRTQLKDTFSPTVLAASSQDASSTSAQASALINVRLLPGSDPDEFFDQLKALFADNPAVSLEIVERPQLPFPEPMDGKDELFASIQKTASRLWPGAITVPGLSPASGDSEFLRRKGIITYGLGPEMDPQIENTAHLADEFIKETDFLKQLQLIAGIVFDFAYGQDLLPLPEIPQPDSRPTTTDLTSHLTQGENYD